MTELLDVGGVKISTVRGSWAEERLEVGDIADGPDRLAMSGRPIETRAAIVRIWRGSTPQNVIAKDGVVASDAPAAWERLIRWIEGWGQVFPCLESSGVPISGAGLTLGPAANLVMGSGMTVLSGQSVFLNHTYAMRVRRGFSPTSKNGWTLIFKRTFQASETKPAGSHWCVATGAVTYTQGAAANPTGVVQYVDGVQGNFNVGNISQIDVSAMQLFGKKTDGTNAAVVFSDVALLPFQLPASWIAQIWTNLINAGVNFPVFPRQRLSGQWLTNEPAPVEAIGRVGKIQQRVGTPLAGTLQNDLRILELAFTEW